MDHGLTSQEATKLVKTSGYNEIPEKHTYLFTKILKNIFSPIGGMLLLASALSFILGKTFDGYFILILLGINIIITLWQENKADTAIRKLNEHLAQQVKTLRDGKWQSIPSRLLVPGDVIQLASGEVIPADGEVGEAHHVSVNESALTGESLPKDKKAKDAVFSGSFLTTGIATITITATGVHTKFGKTVFSVERLRKKSLLEQDILSISRFLTVLSLIAVALLSIVFYLRHAPLLELLTLDLSLIIAGIPISLPTVMTLIIEFGVLALAAKDVIVRRLSALEDLANVNFLLTDKTGTLTKNKITVQDVYAYDGFTHEDVLLYSALPATLESDNPIDQALLEKIKESRIHLPHFEKTDLTPADSERKRTTLVATLNKQIQTISVGAPQIIAQYCSLDKKTKEKFSREVENLAQGGYRTLAVALGKGKVEKNMQIVGLIALSDTLRSDAKSVIEFLEENGIEVSMVTGDNRAIAANIAKQLSLDEGTVVTKDVLDKEGIANIPASLYEKTGAFAEVLPEDKLHLVERAKQFFVIAANGDGVNDLPAIKAANVGIAVQNAVTALKATADIVLLSAGIKVIRDAIIESRKIFERLYTYSLYRISESLRLILTIGILGVFYGVYPMTALQIILLALLNDLPIIALASDHVKTTNRPAKIDAKKRFILSSSFGLVGVANSLLLFFLVRSVWMLPWEVVQTMYFLKLTVSGHMLIYVAHTKERWWKFFPSHQVILATTLTQIVATGLAYTGFLMSGRLSLWQIGFVWVWSFFWMQVSEVMKVVQEKIT